MTVDADTCITAQALWRKEWRSHQHLGPITKLIPLPDGTKFASIAKDSTVKVYRGKDLFPLQSAATKSTSWASDATLITIGGQKRLVVSFYDRQVVFYNVLLAENDPDRPDETSCLGLSGTLHAPTAAGPATCLGSLSAGTDSHEQGEKLLLGDQAGKVHLLRRAPPTMGVCSALDPGADLLELHHHHTQPVTQLLHAPHVGLLSSSLDGTIAIYDKGREALAGSTSVHGGAAVRCMAYHQPLTVAVSGGAGRSALLWHPRGHPGRIVGELPGHAQGLLAISTANLDSTHQIATLSGAGVVTLWDLRTLRVLQRIAGAGEFPTHEDSRPMAMTMDSENRRLLTATRRPCLWKWGEHCEDQVEKTDGSLARDEKGAIKAPSSPKEQHPRNAAADGSSSRDECSSSVLEVEGKQEDGGEVALVDQERIEGGCSVDGNHRTMLGETWRRAHSLLRLAEIPEGLDSPRSTRSMPK